MHHKKSKFETLDKESREPESNENIEISSRYIFYYLTETYRELNGITGIKQAPNGVKEQANVVANMWVKSCIKQRDETAAAKKKAEVEVAEENKLKRIAILDMCKSLAHLC